MRARRTSTRREQVPSPYINQIFAVNFYAWETRQDSNVAGNLFISVHTVSRFENSFNHC